MNAAGLGLVVIGVVVGLAPPYMQDGRWLLGGVIALVGLLLLWFGRED